MFGVVAEVHQEHQQLCADDARENREECGVPHLVGVKSLLPRQTEKYDESGEHAERDQQAVCGLSPTTYVKEIWMHDFILDAESGWSVRESNERERKSRPALPCGVKRL